jgi:hypothetical protein
MLETDSSRHPHVYRSILKKGNRWYDPVNQQVLPVAFRLKSKDEGKLSVLKSVAACAPGTREQCAAGLNECYGEFVLGTERIRGIGLDVQDDDPREPEYSENHASIVGIPQNPTTEEEIARTDIYYAKLAEIARLHFDRDRQWSRT